MQIFLPNPSSDEIDKNTNVIGLYNLVKKGVDNNQRTCYNSGIGTLRSLVVFVCIGSTVRF